VTFSGSKLEKKFLEVKKSSIFCCFWGFSRHFQGFVNLTGLTPKRKYAERRWLGICHTRPRLRGDKLRRATIGYEWYWL